MGCLGFFGFCLRGRCLWGCLFLLLMDFLRSFIMRALLTRDAAIFGVLNHTHIGLSAMRTALLFLSCCCFYFIPCGAQAHRATKQYNKALNRMAKRDWVKAEATLRRTIKEDRTYTEAYKTLAAELLNRHDYKGCVELLVQGEKMCANGATVFKHTIIEAFLGAGDYTEALKRIPGDAAWKKQRDQALFQQWAVQHRDTNAVTPVGSLWGINTKDPELFPMLSSDGKTFYFTRRMNGIDEDFFYAIPDTCGGWQSGRNMGSPPNTLQQEAAQFISADKHYLFFMRCDNRTLSGWDQGGCDLYMAYRADSVWSVPLSFGATINTPGYEGMPCLSSDNRELYFVSNKEGGYGGLDIWSSRFEHGMWQAARNLGPNVNTAGDETAPFVYADNRTLYFASDGRKGMGGSDFYMSKKVDDTGWSEAMNMGMPINTPFDEASMSLNSAGDTAYFASDRDSAAGNFDLYQYTLPQALRPSQVMYVKGRIYDSTTKDPLNYANIYITDSATGKEIYQVQSNRGDGSYTIALPVNHSYHLFTDRLAYGNANDTLHVTDSDAGLTIIRNIALLPSDYVAPTTDSTITMLFFPKNSTVLTDTAKANIIASISPWPNTPGIKILVNGFTDNTGTPMLNEQLSYTRARALQNVILGLGFPDQIMEAQGWGEANPRADNDTDEHRDLNRRVEVIIRK